MDFGTRSNENGNFCIICNCKVEDNMNFCPNCANPLNLDAFKLFQEKIKANNFKILKLLAENTNDENTLKLIQKLTKNLNQL